MPRLTRLQTRIVQVLSTIEPPWTLTGGAALLGIYFGHRITRDVDLFWHDRAELGEIVARVRGRLTQEGLEVELLEHSPSFTQIQARWEGEECVVDLVAEPVPAVDSPRRVTFEGREISVDFPHEILVNKLSALLGRSELRDLRDVETLLSEGGDLERAVADAPRKDGGFSPLILGWVLKGFQVEKLAGRAGLSAEETDALVAFRDRLVDRLAVLGAPPDVGHLRP